MASSGTYVCSLPPELVTKAKDELHEDERWRSRDIQALREMVVAHKGLKCPTDDAFLLKFLRARKFDYERSYNLLLKYYETRAVHPDVFSSFRPSCVKHIYEAGVTCILPKRDRHGRRVMLFRPGRWDPSVVKIGDSFRANIMSLEKLLLEEENQVIGMVFLLDPTNITIAHARAMESGYHKLFTGFIQDAFPMRLKALRVVNEPALFSYIFMLIKQFMREKMVSRFQLYGPDHAALREDLGEDCLPEEYGGKAGPVDDIVKKWTETMLACESYFGEMEKYHLEVPREIIKQKNQEALESMVGTYKKLNVD